MNDADLTRLAADRQRRRLVVFSVSMLIGLPLAVVVGLAAGDPRFRLAPLAVSLIVVGAALPAAAGVGFVWIARHRHARWTEPVAFGGLERGQRRRILRALRRGGAISEVDRPYARQVAGQVSRLRWLARMLLVLPLFEIPQLFAGSWRRVLAATLMIGWWSLAGRLLYLRRTIAARSDL